MYLILNILLVSTSLLQKASGANSRVTPDPPRHALRVGGSKISFNTLQTDPATGEKVPLASMFLPVILNTSWYLSVGRYVLYYTYHYFSLQTKAKLNRREDASASLSSATKARTSFRSKDNSVPQAEIDTSLMEVDDFDTVEDVSHDS